MSIHLNRRCFLKQSFAAGAVAWIGGTSASAKILGASDRLRIAVVGCNGRGKSHIEGWLGQPNV